MFQVPSAKFNHTLASQFTISTWMKHEPSEEKDQKEHIMCNADGESEYTSYFIYNRGAAVA